MAQITLQAAQTSAQTAVDVGVKLVNNPGNLKNILKVVSRIFEAIGALKGIDGFPPGFIRFGKVLNDAIGAIDLLQILPDAAELYKLELKVENSLKIAFSSMFLGCDIMDWALFLDNYKLFELTERATAIGGKHVFVNSLTALAGAAFGVMLVDVIVFEWPKADTAWKKFRRGLVVSRCIFEVSGKAFPVYGPGLLAMVGITATPVILAVVPTALGGVAAGCAVAHFFTGLKKEG